MTSTAVIDEVAAKLESVCWDFSDSQTSVGPHRIHPYPAKFIPQIPRALIELFHPGDESAVLDPFCGSGTTLVEAVRAGLPAVGVDLHPLATLIAKVKTTPLGCTLKGQAKGACDRALSAVEHGAVTVPDIPRLDHWFQPDVQVALSALIGEIEGLQDRTAADALRVAVSSIIVRVSNQESDTRYAAIEKGLCQDDVWTAFLRAANVISDALANTGADLFRDSPKVSIITRDITQVEPGQLGKRVGLVVTSPPYPNAYEYWLYHKYRMYWLGMDPLAVRKAEIGARCHYFKKKHQTEADFERQMGQCFGLLAKALEPGGCACFVVGRSVIHGRQINNEDLLERAARPHGFQKVGSIQRTIAANRKSFNLAHASIKREGVLVFKLGEQ